MDIDTTSPSRDTARSIALLVGAAVAAAAYVVLPLSPGVEGIRVAAPLVALCVLVLALVRHRPSDRLPWLFMALSLALLTAAHALSAARYFDDAETYPSAADALFLAAGLAMLVAVVLLSRHGAPKHDAFGLFEIAIVTIAIGTGVWLAVVEPYLATSEHRLAPTIVAGIVPSVGALAFAAAFRSVSHAGFSSPGPVLIATAVAVQTLADACRGMLERNGGFEHGGPVAALGVLAPLVLAAGVLHPTMDPDKRDPHRAPGLSVGRTVGISIAVLTPLSVLLALTVGNLGTTTTRVMVSVCAVISVVLALARLWGLMDDVRGLTERRGQDRLAAMVEHSSDVVILVDEQGDVKYASPGLSGTMGHRAVDWIGRPLVDLIADEDRAAAHDEIARVIALGPDSTVKFESNLVRVDGQRRRMEATVANLLGGDAVDGIVATFRDVTEQRNLERQLSHRAFHDELTGLANRALFLDRVDHALRVERPESDPVMVLFVDLDDFKGVNDGLGHAVGDQLLREIADRIRIVSGSGDTPARLGGDEFAVLLEDRGGSERALDVAERLLDQLRRPVQLGGYDLIVLASVGVAVATPGMTTSSLLRDADTAMYEAKRAGKGQIKVFDPSMRLESDDAPIGHGDLSNALERNEFRLVYQPYVSLVTGEVAGAEALLRWNHPELGDVAPSVFLPVAERVGLIADVGRWVLRTAMEEAARWQVAGRRDVSINVSSVQLGAVGFVDDVRIALEATGIAPDAVLIEVTEADLADEVESSSGVFNALRSLGVRIVIDDFGTGFCSLASLQRFPIDRLKIDRSCIDEIDSLSERRSLAETILQTTTALGLTSVAEGIERPSQLTVLRSLGCDLGQGELLSAPLEVDVLRPRFGVAGERDAYAAVDA